jgi:hypothetical protein
MAAVRATAPTVAEAKAKGISDAFKFVKHQLFLAGLKDGLRDKVLQAEKDTFNESVKVARNLETIQKRSQEAQQNRRCESRTSA